MRYLNYFIHKLPISIQNRIKYLLEKIRLSQVGRRHLNSANLKSINEICLRDILTSKEATTAWANAEAGLSEFRVPDGTGGVNPGDRKAIFFLACYLKPESILEVGTHIGASTIHLASALQYFRDDEKSASPRLFSVDILDVNDVQSTPWLKYGSEYSPKEMLRRMGMDGVVEFRAIDSLQFMSGCDRKFDFIFLDGSHSAERVYQEVPAAIPLLNKGGVILLHDYFPELKPLWANGSVISGPFLAVDRLKAEGAEIEILPLDELPWATKLSSQKTSLALLVRR